MPRRSSSSRCKRGLRAESHQKRVTKLAKYAVLSVGHTAHMMKHPDIIQKVVELNSDEHYSGLALLYVYDPDVEYRHKDNVESCWIFENATHARVQDGPTTHLARRLAFMPDHIRQGGGMLVFTGRFDANKGIEMCKLAVTEAGVVQACPKSLQSKRIDDTVYVWTEESKPCASSKARKRT